MVTRRLAALLMASAPFASAQRASGKTRGIAMAAIRMEVFSDFQCPACKQLHEGTLHQVETEYADKGKLLIIHRDFPLPIHAHSRPAAYLGCAASRMGKYDLVADAIFKNQDTWAKTGNLDAFVSPLFSPVDFTKLKALAKSAEVLAEVEADIKRGTEIKLTQTPTMLFSHKNRTYPVTGVVTFPVVSKFIDQLLSS
jgi:protein-disulfide isomerase